jgi:hypothetical protein
MVAKPYDLGLTDAEIARSRGTRNANVTRTAYAELTDGGLERASEKLAEGGFGA